MGGILYGAVASIWHVTNKCSAQRPPDATSSGSLTSAADPRWASCAQAPWELGHASRTINTMPHKPMHPSLAHNSDRHPERRTARDSFVQWGYEEKTTEKVDD